MDTVDADAPDVVIDPTGTVIPRQAGPPGAEQVSGAEQIDDGLTDRERQVLAFERQWWKHAGAKEQAIRDLFDLSATRYYQLLNTLLDKPAALAYDAVVVGRLRRLRATRSRTRTGGRRGPAG
jgi:Protein of unknown function (DUF3263)